MMGNGTAITTSELNVVLRSLKQQRSVISDTYNAMIKKVLEDSSSCFAVSGLDYSTIISTFNSTFQGIDKNLEALINALENNVIKNYSEMVVAIRRMFGTEFASKMSELLGIK